MEITRIGAKRFFCHSSVMWLNTESVPEAFPPPPSLWQSSFLFPAIRFPQSLTISLSVLFHLLLPPSLIWPTSVSHSMVWLVIWLFVSLRWHAPSTSHSLIPLFYFKKNILCPLSSFFLSQMVPVAHCLTLPTPSSLLECYLSCFTVVAPCSDCVKRPTPPLYMCIYCMYFCISIYTYPLL